MIALWQGLWTALGAEPPAEGASATAAVAVETDKDMWETWGPVIIDYGLKVLGVIALFLVGRWVASKLANMIERRLGKRNFDRTLTRFFSNLVRTIILIVVLLACLSIFGIETTSLAAIIGASALAIGIALQGSLSNFAAGIMLIIFKPYRVGDLVEISGETGTVFEIGMFTTQIDTPDNVRVIIPNGTIFSGVIENLSHHDRRRIGIPVGVDYGADIDATRRALETVIEQVPSRVPDAPHDVFLKKLGGSSVDWEVRVWAAPAHYWDVYQEAVRAIKYALDGAGISIPFPQMDVHLDGRLAREQANEASKSPPRSN